MRIVKNFNIITFSKHLTAVKAFPQTASNSSVGTHLKFACWGCTPNPRTSGQVGPKWRRGCALCCGISLSRYCLACDFPTTLFAWNMYFATHFMQIQKVASHFLLSVPLLNSVEQF